MPPILASSQVLNEPHIHILRLGEAPPKHYTHDILIVCLGVDIPHRQRSWNVRILVIPEGFPDPSVRTVINLLLHHLPELQSVIRDVPQLHYGTTTSFPVDIRINPSHDYRSSDGFFEYDSANCRALVFSASITDGSATAFDKVRYDATLNHSCYISEECVVMPIYVYAVSTI